MYNSVLSKSKTKKKDIFLPIQKMQIRQKNSLKTHLGAITLNVIYWKIHRSYI